MTNAASYWIGFNVREFQFAQKMGLVMFVDLHRTQKAPESNRDVSHTCHQKCLLMISGLELNFHAPNVSSCV